MSKKPAKRTASAVTAVPKVDEGFNVLYAGIGKTVTHTCPECGKKTGKGMLREYDKTVYCSVGCVRAYKSRNDIS
jgi:hypothetical protein